MTLMSSIYWSEQTSMRTRMLLMLDWIKRGIFGRDLSKVSTPLRRSELGRLMTSVLTYIGAIASAGMPSHPDCPIP